MVNISTRICKICNKEFKPSSCHQIYCKDLHYRICPICGKSYPERNLDKFKFPPTTCSMECRVKKREQTSMQKYGIKTPGNNPIAREKSRKTMQKHYGVDYAQESAIIKQKSKDTWMKHYGVDNPQKVSEIKEKTKNTNIERFGSSTYLTSKIGKVTTETTMLEKYGTTIPLRNAKINQKWRNTNTQRYGAINPLCNPKIKEKAQTTSQIKYGTKHPMSSDVVKQRVHDTFFRNYGVDNCSKSEKIIAKIRQSFYDHYGVHSVMEAEEIASKIRDTNQKRYGVPYYVMLPNVARSSGRISKINTMVFQKLQKASIPCCLEYTIDSQSYDIYIPQSNTLLEINPTYTHNTIGNHWNPKGLDKNYHLKKTTVAIENGYRCMHLWDWDSTSKFINALTNKNTVYVTQSPELLDSEEAKIFIQKYSLYDTIENINHMLFLGLRYKTKLMLVMGFKLSNFITNTWTLVCIEQRFQYTVYNGTQILLDHFIKLCHPNKVIAYADFSKTNGEMLENLGFKYNSFILPTKIWSKGRHAIIDNSSILTEAMIEDKWLPVYNCGYKVYELNGK